MSRSLVARSGGAPHSRREPRGRRRAPARLLLGALLLAAGWTPAATTAEPPDGALQGPLSRAQRRWVDSTLRSLSLPQKAAQLVMVRVHGRYENPRSAAHRRLLAEVRDLEVGGLVLFRSELETVPRLLNELQTAARLPLLVSADLERGLSFRIESGTVPLPYAMAVGASGSPEAARFSG